MRLSRLELIGWAMKSVVGVDIRKKFAGAENGIFIS